MDVVPHRVDAADSGQLLIGLIADMI